MAVISLSSFFPKARLAFITAILQTIQSILLQTETFLHEHTKFGKFGGVFGVPDDAGSFFPKALIGFIMIPVTAQALPFWHTQLD